MATFSSPGKVFLLGEYLVLGGGPALIAAISPRFELKTAPRQPSLSLPFPPESPAGKLASHLRSKYPSLSTRLSETEFTLIDPVEGRGGIGASSAAFVLLYRWAMGAMGEVEHVSLSTEWKDVLTLFRGLTETSDPLTRPSGGDVVSQWRGGITLFEPAASACREAFPYFNWNLVLVFSTTHLPGFKTATHTHLDALDSSLKSKLEDTLLPVFENGMLALESGDAPEFGKALTAYGRALSDLKLEIPQMRELVGESLKLPGVLGAKGTGAMQSDALVVVVDDPSRRSLVVETLAARGLTLLTEGISLEQGVLQC